MAGRRLSLLSVCSLSADCEFVNTKITSRYYKIDEEIKRKRRQFIVMPQIDSRLSHCHWPRPRCYGVTTTRVVCEELPFCREQSINISMPILVIRHTNDTIWTRWRQLHVMVVCIELFQQLIFKVDRPISVHHVTSDFICRARSSFARLIIIIY